MIEIPDAAVPTAELDRMIEAKRLAAEIIGTWPGDEKLDAGALIRERAELAECRSAFLDLAYEQYCRERDAGENVDREAFAAKFPAHRRTLLRLLEVHDALAESPGSGIRWPECEESFAGFDLKAELGRGAFSRVFLAQETSIGRRRVVLKVCLSGEREADVLGRLQHPNICEIHSIQLDEATGLTAICMPYVTDETLVDFIDSARLEDAGGTTAVLRIGAQVAAALACAHEQGIVHGDIKPSNILISGERALLIDFNLSAGHHDGAPLLGGTLPYMATEQLAALSTGQASAVRDQDHHAPRTTHHPPLTKSEPGFGIEPAGDVFALAVTLFEALAGRLPWGELPRSNDRRELIQYLLYRHADVAPLLQVHAPGVPTEASALIRRCLSPDPGRRPSAAELSAQLNRLLPSEETSPPQAAKPRVGLVLAAAAVVLGVVSVVIALQSPGNRVPEGVSPPGRTDPAPIEQADALIATGRFSEADRLLENAPERVRRDPRTAALRGYCKARLADAAADPKDRMQLAQEAIALFERAAREKYPSKELLLENIGYCRVIVSKSRPLGNGGAGGSIPENPQKAFEVLSDALAGARQSEPLDVSFVDRVARRFPDAPRVRSTALQCYACAAAHDVTRRDELVLWAVEQAWRSLDDRQYKFSLMAGARSCTQFAQHPEVSYLRKRPRHPLTLHHPSVAQR